MKKIILILLSAVTLSTAPLSAEFFNQRNIIPGERAALLGGAYTALSEDVTGTYYNPAGIAFIDQFAVSTNASLYSYRSMKRDDTEGFTFDTDSIDMSPTFFGFNLSMKPVNMAFSIYQTDNYVFADIDPVGNTVYKFEIDAKSYLIGPSIAYKITDSLAVGVSALYRHYAGNATLYLGPLVGFQETEMKYDGLVAGAGIKFNITDSIKMGASYFSQSIDLHGTNNYTYLDGADQVTGEGSCKMRSPHKFSFGLAYDVKKKYTISVDGTYYMAMDYSQPHAMMDISAPDSRYKEDSHYDISVGGEYFLNDIFSLRIGFFTNTSGAPVEKRSEELNLYGGSFGLGFYTGEVSSGIGFSGMYGSEDEFRQGTTQMSGGRYDKLYISLIIGGSMKF